MLFSSIVFLFTFLPIVLILYYVLPAACRNPVLLLASLVFYAWGEPVYIFLMILSILFNYISGLDIARNLENKKRRRGALYLILLLILRFLDSSSMKDSCWIRSTTYFRCISNIMHWHCRSEYRSIPSRSCLIS